jgi:hypothetical protein
LPNPPFRGDFSRAVGQRIQWLIAKIPYAMEQGISWRDQGIFGKAARILDFEISNFGQQQGRCRRRTLLQRDFKIAIADGMSRLGAAYHRASRPHMRASVEHPTFPSQWGKEPAARPHSVIRLIFWYL